MNTSFRFQLQAIRDMLFCLSAVPESPYDGNGGKMICITCGLGYQKSSELNKKSISWDGYTVLH